MNRKSSKNFSPTNLNFKRGKSKINELPPGMSTDVLVRPTKLESVRGNLITFRYNSPTSVTPNPLVLVTVRKGRNGKWFKFKGSDVRQNTYIQGLVLNDVTDFLKAYMIKRFSRDGFLTYHELKTANSMTKANFRVYNDRYIQEMKVVNALQFVKNQLGEI